MDFAKRWGMTENKQEVKPVPQPTHWYEKKEEPQKPKMEVKQKPSKRKEESSSGWDSTFVALIGF